ENSWDLIELRICCWRLTRVTSFSAGLHLFSLVLASVSASRPSRWCTPGARFSENPDRKSTRLNSSHLVISYAVFCLKKKIKIIDHNLYDLVLCKSFNYVNRPMIVTFSKLYSSVKHDIAAASTFVIRTCSIF